MSTVQAVLFQGFTAPAASKWLNDHGYKPIKKMHREGTLMRYRMTAPDYKRYTTTTLINPKGQKIFLVLGWRK
jgi:hypothetical protein